MTIWDIRPLLTAQFWLQTNPSPLLPFFEKAFFIVYVCALLVAVIIGTLERKTKNAITKRFFERIRRVLTTLGITGLLLAFFLYERTPVLSMRLLTLLLWIGALAWMIAIIVWRVRVAPRIAKEVLQKQVFEKYLPK